MDSGEFWLLLALSLAIIAVLAIVVFLVDLLVRVFAGWTWRRTTERMVLGQVVAVVRQNLPLAQGLSVAAESERGGARIQLLRMSKLLSQGATLSEAMRIGFTCCSGLVLSLVEAGEASGQLAPSLQQAERYLAEQAGQRHARFSGGWFYCLSLFVFTCLVATGFLVAVVPKYSEIVKDFEVRMPGVTMSLMGVAGFMANDVAVVVGFVCLAVLAVVFYLGSLPRRVPHLSVLSRLADWSRWHVPGGRRLETARGLTAMLSFLRHAVSGGMDLVSAARLASGLDVNVRVRKKMMRFADLLDRGTSLGDACRLAELGSVTAVALSAGQRSGNLDAGLRYAADYHDAIVGRWVIVFYRLLAPLGTLVLATLVAWIVLAMFMPLVALINAAGGF